MNTIVEILFIIVLLLLAVAYLIYCERKIIGAIQLRHGPSVVGKYGLLQPFADAIKLLFKEIIIPFHADRILFILAPILTLMLSLIAWAVIPFGADIITDIHSEQHILAPKVIANINVGVLYLFAVSSLGVYGIVIAGWSSHSNYALLGALRSTAQMISYEVSIGLIIATIVIITGTLNISEMVIAKHNMPFWIDILLIPIGIIFFISLLAETNRHPFDLPEAESELVSGYNVEYSSMPFSLFFLAEYANMILASTMMTLFFLGAWYPPIELKIFYKISSIIWFLLKILLLLFIFIWIRATIPRYRYDQLMNLGWKVFLPFSLLWVILISGLLLFTGNLMRI
ncbi:NADH-quinone oxidoreductase subunit NuoH [Wolbachia endosymbiont of Howardula sp.]|uniref:NADH-quinone oxidoreductase subunit NuoH n=1 Tax=Wolbachia endosymbiont of Howardula sp. TaxID=2916816 RepID=UPI00217E6C29|nr:NADH-quinone oxidoreductase subunit NuoH [Wolbachia endosymbiont of Howardula sp.]UWI83053.1 NADH-quinone oxidoreductase subunit NuoH [Wolbachia endosymbiont of Howardula sp.]